MGTLSNFPESLDKWLECSRSPPWRAMGTGIKRAVTRSRHCCLPGELFWTPSAQTLSPLPYGTELGYSWEAQGVGWVSWDEETKKVRWKEDITPVYMKVLLRSLWHHGARGVGRQGYVFFVQFFYKTSGNSHKFLIGLLKRIIQQRN